MPATSSTALRPSRGPPVALSQTPILPQDDHRRPVERQQIPKTVVARYLRDGLHAAGEIRLRTSSRFRETPAARANGTQPCRTVPGKDHAQPGGWSTSAARRHRWQTAIRRPPAASTLWSPLSLTANRSSSFFGQRSSASFIPSERNLTLRSQIMTRHCERTRGRHLIAVSTSQRVYNARRSNSSSCPPSAAAPLNADSPNSAEASRKR